MKLASRFLSTLMNILWALALIGLPLTTFPLIHRFTRSMVSPFSALPVLLMAALWLVAYLLRGGELPAEIKPLSVFFFIALLASACTYFIEVPTYRDASIISREIEAFFTLSLGLIFYLVFSTWPRDEQRLLRSMHWLNLGGALLLLFTLNQMHLIITQANHYAGWILTIQKWLAFKPHKISLGFNRVSGLAYEPSWFAHQMILIYLPLWLAATVNRKSASRFRLLGFSVENILLVLGLVEFIFSSPRISLLGLLLILIFLAISATKWLVRRFSSALSALFTKRKQHVSNTMKTVIVIGVSITILSVYIGLAAGLIYAASQLDYRLGFLFQKPPTLEEIKGALTLNEDAWLALGLRFVFFERTLYWVTGLRVFSEHPWLGVGLGNTGFFGLEQMPNAGWWSYEIRNLFYQKDAMLNTKSMWIRLLAETGLAGFATFCMWLYILWRSISLVKSTRSPVLRLLATSGQFFLLAYLAEGFSIDSFAMPYLWVGAGLITATAFTYRKKLAETEKTSAI